ncbi:hypothetical protein Q604_UNBc4C00098G0001, partial [human gut metagenome]
MATTSSGFTDLFGSFPVSALTASTTAGIRVEPPTRITSSISDKLKPASERAWRTGTFVRSTRSRVKSSNLARVKVISKWRGPASPAVINGKLICVEVTPERSFFAFSAASFKRCIAILSVDKSIPFSFLNSATKWSMIFWSKSSPPSLLSPAVDNTSKTPSPNSRIETSN